MLLLELRLRRCAVHMEGGEPHVHGEVNEVVGPVHTQTHSGTPCWPALGCSVRWEATATEATPASPAGCNQGAVGKGISGVAQDTSK